MPGGFDQAPTPNDDGLEVVLTPAHLVDGCEIKESTTFTYTGSGSGSRNSSGRAPYVPIKRTPDFPTPVTWPPDVRKQVQSFQEVRHQSEVYLKSKGYLKPKTIQQRFVDISRDWWERWCQMCDGLFHAFDTVNRARVLVGPAKRP